MALLGPNGAQLAAPRPQQTQNPAPEEPAPPARVTTAFLVYQLPNGHWVTSDDISAPIVPMRKPVPDDLIGACENIKAQVIAQQSAAMAAQMTVQTQMSLAAQIQEQQQNAAIAQMVTNGGRT